ncbi:integrase catalytic region domain protein [Mycobacterium xenopi 3993]|nr:integrase catalytic region domain protein [Mycobacterium xenopi 3993]
MDVGAGLRRVAALAGVDRKTARSYTNAAALAGLDRGGALDQLTDELIGAVIEAVRPDRPDGHGQVWEVLRANHDQIVKWVEEGLTVVKICDLLERRGTAVPSGRCTGTARSAPSTGPSQRWHGAGGRW